MEPNTIAQISVAAYEQRKRLANALRGLRRFLVRKDTSVVVFGPGGVGKTTLGAFLSEPLAEAVRSGKYQESIGPETY
ncbi:MAG: hypothetical protein OHK0029_33410 [Armatimonadaceae bacterium]